jgi:tRNA dimethylallyltransferase
MDKLPYALSEGYAACLIKFKFTGIKQVESVSGSGKINLVCVLGPTASGKTRFATCLAAELGSVIISADSRQVYRYMNIGTGKDYDEYKIGDKIIDSHLIDIADPGEEYNVFRYQEDFSRIFKTCHEHGKIPVLCGGTGLYLEAVLKGYKLTAVPLNQSLRRELADQETGVLVRKLESYRKLHNSTDILIRKRLIRAIEIEEFLKNNPDHSHEKIPVNPLIFGIDIDRDSRRKAITERLHKRLSEGMVEETENLLSMGISHEKLEFFGLEYRFISRYLRGLLNYDDMINSLNIAIHQYAKRQMTWFRKMEREGLKIHWIPASLPPDEKLSLALFNIKTHGIS